VYSLAARSSTSPHLQSMASLRPPCALLGFEGPFPLGPCCFDDLDDWPLNVLSCIFEKGDGQDVHRRDHFEAHLKRGIVASSDYSGLWGDREAMQQIMVACQEKFQWGFAQKAVRFLRACDIDPIAKCALLFNAGSQCCVLNDLMDRLPGVARSWVDAAAPGPTTPVDRAIAAYKDILQWLDCNREWVFPTDAQANCSAHGCSCYVHPSSVLSHGGVSCATPCSKKRRGVDHSEALEARADDVGERPLIMNSAGTSCTGWTPTGKCLRHADPSEKFHAVWVTERKVLAERCEEDLFFQENSSAYDYQDKICSITTCMKD
jgi:hypothetical protein